MNVIMVWGLALLLRQHGRSVVGIIAAALLLLAVVLIFEACRTARKMTPTGVSDPTQSNSSEHWEPLLADKITLR
jgi:hypothetical protein